MRDLPMPTSPLSIVSWPSMMLGLVTRRIESNKRAVVVPRPAQLPVALPVELPDALNEAPAQARGRCGIAVSWAKTNDEVRQAQRLDTTSPGHDVDRFDNYCEHLLVRDVATREVVGTYRVLTPAQAKRAGGTYTDTEFNLDRLQVRRERMVELGRSCVHKDYRQGAVIMALWGALAEFMVRNKLDTMIGCASIPMLHNGVVSGDVASSIWRKISQQHLVPLADQVEPRLPLPVDEFNSTLDVEPPALIKGYLRLGAKVLGMPAWDPDFNTADVPMMMCINELPARYRKHFLGA
jgi:putative hemolysin